MQLEAQKNPVDILNQFYKFFIRDLEILDKDFELLLNSEALKVVANLSTRFFQKRAATVIDSFENILDVYREEYDNIILKLFSPMTPENKKLLSEEQKKFRQDLTVIIQRLNVKAQILIEDLKAANLTLDANTQKRLLRIKTITVAEIFQIFKTTD